MDTSEEEEQIDLAVLSENIRETNQAISNINKVFLEMLNELTFSNQESKNAVTELIKIFEEV